MPLKTRSDMKKEMDVFCPYYDKCSICSESIMQVDVAGFKYRTMYCLSEIDQFKKCSLYMLTKKMGLNIPPDVLPDSVLLSKNEVRRIKNLVLQ